MTLFSLPFTSLFSQKIFETGLPYIQNYSPEIYGAFDQNWGAVQDSSGIMYFANGDGVLSYDGTHWKILKLPNKGTVFALNLAPGGEIYVGSVDELGYLSSNARGELTYISLLSHLPEEFRNFNEIKYVCSSPAGVFFSSRKYIFQWDGTKFQTWENSGDSFIFSLGGTLLKRMAGEGLTTFKNNQFELVSQGELFAEERIYSILPFNGDQFLIATRDKLFVFNGETITPFSTNFPDFFNDNIIYCGVALNDGGYAFGSLNKGILIIDAEGKKEVVLSKKGLLGSNRVLSVFQDRSGILWASLNSGIAKIEYPSPFSFFNKHNGAPDMIFDFQRYQEKLYIAGPEGLFVLNSDNDLFEPVAGDFGMIWDMILFEDKMLIGGTSGAFEMKPTGEFTKLFALRISTFRRSKVNTKRIFIGTADGLYSMFYEGGQWMVEHMFEGINVNIDKIIEDNNGQLWLDTDKNEVIRVSFDNLIHAQYLKAPKITVFKTEDGLPDNTGEPYLIENHFYFIADNEAYKFDAQSQKFVNDKDLWGKLGIEEQEVKINFVDDEGRIWLIEVEDERRINQLVAIPEKGGTYNLINLEEQRIMDLRRYDLLAELADSVVWYKGKPGIVRHDLKKGDYKNIIEAGIHISGVLWQGDSLLSGGYNSAASPELPFKNNRLRFEYASPGFYDEHKNQFQYYLQGFDEGWSPWTSETQKDYTNIPEGDYHFKVRSKNIWGTRGKETAYAFTILSPWYRSWWAYLLYGLGTIGIIGYISKRKSLELARKNEVLEGIIRQRTLEIQHKNELLSLQTEKLVQLNEAKTQLYSNITHEFRTPLTVILGMTDTLRSNVESNWLEGVGDSLEMIRRNGKNLLLLVNEMLDLAKSESGSLSLRLVQTDVVPLIKYLSESFHSLAEENQINLTVYSEIDELIMDLDIAKLTSIISNVLSNAIKFTPPFGKIIVHINKVAQEDGDYFFLKVKDNGIGISEEELPHVFNRFYQADASSSRKNEGTGIGLALTKELVGLMKGTIEVKSKRQKGSEFIIHIPIARTAPISKDVPLTGGSQLYLSPQLSVPVEPYEINDELPVVLIIEDNKDVAHYLKTCFHDKYETFHALNGNDGLAMAFEKMPDIIICDVMMPEKDGYEVCGILKNDSRTDHIPIIMLTAKVTRDDKLRGLSRGADAYLTKPFEKAELFTRIDNLILLRKKMISRLEKGSFSSLLREKVENPHAKFIQQLVLAIHNKLDDSDFGSLHLAREVHLSESQLYRKIKAMTGKSTAIFIRSIRLQHARELLQSTDKNVSEVAYETGFNHPSWFSKAFKEEFGYPPSDVHQ